MKWLEVPLWLLILGFAFGGIFFVIYFNNVSPRMGSTIHNPTIKRYSQYNGNNRTRDRQRHHKYFSFNGRSSPLMYSFIRTSRIDLKSRANSCHHQTWGFATSSSLMLFTLIVSVGPTTLTNHQSQTIPNMVHARPFVSNEHLWPYYKENRANFRQKP